MVLAAGILASAMGFIDGSVVSIAIPAIRATLGASLGEATWVNNGYMVTLSALILVGGAFADRFGLARVFGLGIALFMATSLVCAIAPSPEILIAARLAQGVGAAAMVPGSLAMISRAYPREIRGRAIGLWAAASALTTAMGPILGGLMLTFGGDQMWRGIFAINLPIGLLALWLLIRAVRRDAARPGEPVDLTGGALATLGLGLLAWALAHGEDGSGVAGALPIGLGLSGAACLGLFVLHQHRSPHPMLPLGLFRSRVFSAANAVTFALYFGLSAILFFLPMLTIAGWGVSEIVSTFAFAPLPLCLVLFSTRFGRLADRIGPGPLIAAGAGTVAAALVWLSVAVGNRDIWTGVLPPMAFLGLGMSMVVAPLSTAVMGAVEDRRSGTASGVNNAISRSAGLIAVAAMGSVAGAAYAALGGPGSYGLASDAPGHAEAMTGAFAVIARICATLALVAAGIALVGLRGGSAAAADQTGS